MKIYELSLNVLGHALTAVVIAGSEERARALVRFGQSALEIQTVKEIGTSSETAERVVVEESL